MDDSLFDDEPSPEEVAAAQAAALRGRSQPALAPNPEALQRQRQMGNLGLLIGGPLQGIGQAQLSDARAQQQQAINAQRYGQLADYRGQMAKTAQEKAETAKSAADAKAAYDSQIADLKQQLADRQQAKLRKNGDVVAFDPNTGEAKVALAGPKLLSGGKGRGGGTGSNSKQDDKDAKDFDARMSASGGRAGALGQDYVRLANAQNLKTILKNGSGVIPPQMVAEATAALGRLVTGGVVTEGTMEKMIPHTSGMDLASKLQYITGSPHDAGVKDFLEYMGHTADREAENATQRMKAERLARLTAFGGYYGRNKSSLARQAQAYGLTPQDVDSAFGAAPPAASPAPAAATVDPKMRIQARLKELDPTGTTDPKKLREQLQAEGLLPPPKVASK